MLFLSLSNWIESISSRLPSLTASFKTESTALTDPAAVSSPLPSAAPSSSSLSSSPCSSPSSSPSSSTPSLLSSLSPSSFSLVLVFYSVSPLLLAYASYKLIVRQYLMHRRLRNSGVPGSTFIPIVGNLPIVLRSHLECRQMDLTDEFVEKYGPIFSSTLGTSCPRLMIIDPEYVSQIYKFESLGFYQRPPIFKSLIAPGLGDHSLIMSEGVVHQRHRKMISPAFHYANLKSMTEIMIRQTNNATQRWVKKINATVAQSGTGKAVELDLHEEMVALTLSIILSCAFGIESEAGVDAPKSKQPESPSSSSSTSHSSSGSVLSMAEKHSLHSHLLSVMNAAFERYLFMVSTPLLRHLPFPSWFRLRRHQKALNGIVSRLIEDRSAKRSHPNCSGPDLLELLLNAKDTEGNGFSSLEIQQESLTFLFAGHETTSSLMSWCFMFLLQNPEAFADLRRELDEVLKGEAPNSDQFKELPVLEAILNETLRLRPPATFISKESIKDHVLGGGETGLKPLTIEAGMEVVVCSYAIHQMASYWDEPRKFDYTRWLKRGENGKKLLPKHPFAFLPFSSGSRACIGQNFALMEAKIMLAILVQHFDFTLIPGQTFPIEVLITLKPKNGVKATISIRKR